MLSLIQHGVTSISSNRFQWPQVWISFLQRARKANLQEVLRDRENKALAKRVMNVAWNDEGLALGEEVVAWCNFVWSLQQLMALAHIFEH